MCKGIDVGLFVERAPSAALQQIVAGALAANATVDPATIRTITASAQAAAETGPVTVHARRIAMAILVGMALIAAGVWLVWLGDQEAIDQAKFVIANPTYKAPTLGIGAAGTSLITLGGAWSAALIGVVLSEK